MNPGGGSRIVIMDSVLPDVDVGVRAALGDVVMMALGGHERTEDQWKTLLESVGFHITRIVVSKGAARNRDGLVEAIRESTSAST